MTDRWYVRALIGLLVAMVVTLYAGCSAPAPTSSPSPTAEAVTLTAKAEAEAKAILEAAEATAIVQRARETAQALTQGPGAAPTATPTNGISSRLSGPTSAGTAGANATPFSGAGTPAPTRAPAASATSAAASTTVTVEKVAFVADGGLVMVSYRAPAAAAQRYWQGSVYMVDEATGAKFDNVATMPVVGPLIQRPKQDGQAGYIIFYNRSAEGTALKPGDVVAVVLNTFKQEHVAVAAE